MILSARAVGRDGTERVINVEGQSLIWSNTPDWTISRIPAGVARHLDVAAVHQWEADHMIISVSPRPTDARHLVSERAVELHVVATAVDSDPAYYTLTIEYEGAWRETDDWPPSFTVRAQRTRTRS